MDDPGKLTRPSARERLLDKLTAPALERPVAEQAAAVVLSEVVAALEFGYSPQNPSGHHPADYVTKRFEMPGHEGLADA